MREGCSDRPPGIASHVAKKVTITTARARRGDCKTFAFNAIRADLEGLRRMFPCIRGLLVRCVHLGSAACVPATVEPLHEGRGGQASASQVGEATPRGRSPAPEPAQRFTHRLEWI
jgi:hypothetical protein